MKITPILLCILVLGCGDPPATKFIPPPANKWSDARLAPILEAQDHRDSKALLTLLRDSTSIVREAAGVEGACGGLPGMLGGEGPGDRGCGAGIERPSRAE